MKTMTVASPIKNIRRLSLVRQDGGEIWLRHPLLVLVAISVARPATCRDVFSSRFTGAPNVGGQPRAAPTRLVFFARGRARLVGCSALFGGPPLPRTALVVLRPPRSASLTASAEGIRAVVLVPNKRALNLYDHEVVPIELANGSRLPVLREG